MCRTQYLLALYFSLAHSLSWDIAVTTGSELVFFTNEKMYTESVKGGLNLTALAYDEVRNKLMYVDKQSDNDTICVYDISSKDYKCLIEKNGRNIQGLAFDPATEMLFFTDANERSINWISLKHSYKNNVYGNLLIKMDDEIPGAIAVDSCRKYIYWVNTNSTIERARFNGLDREVIIHRNIFLPVRPLSLAIDQQTQKIYWIISMFGHYFKSADLDGKNEEILCIIEDENCPLPNTLTILNDSIYWLGWRNSYKSIWQLSKSSWKPSQAKEIFTFYSESPVGIVANYKIMENYGGERCDVSVCQSYCFQGDCSVSAHGQPKCRCNNGYSGERCEVNLVNACHGYCLNNGICTLNEKSELVCQCTADYEGERCGVPVCQNYCFQGDCNVSAEGQPKCRCNAGYSGERCEVNACHGYCLNNGVCTLNEESKQVCQCMGDYDGERCDVSVCLNYCFQGECSYIVEGQLKCRCDTGYSGERCEVNACQGYCLNNGVCSLNEKSKPVCQCTADYEGERCSVSAEEQPKCRCNAEYSGESRELDACYGHCLNNGVCSLNEEDEPVCQCIGNHEGSRCEAVNDVIFTTTPTYYSAETMNLTAYVLSIFENLP